jgi:hypothetical protein
MRLVGFFDERSSHRNVSTYTKQHNTENRGHKSRIRTGGPSVRAVKVLDHTALWSETTWGGGSRHRWDNNIDRDLKEEGRRMRMWTGFIWPRVRSETVMNLRDISWPTWTTISFSRTSSFHEEFAKFIICTWAILTWSTQQNTKR